MRQRESMQAARRGPARGDEEPEFLDTQEQDALIAAFEKQHQQSLRFWKLCLSLLILLYAAFLAHGAVTMLRQPWTQRWQAELRSTLNSTTIALAEWMAVIALAALLLSQWLSATSARLLFRVSAALSVGLAIFWSPVLFKLASPYRWRMLWLPLGNVVFLLLSLYVDRSLSRLGVEIGKLKGLKYDHKRV